MSSFSFCEPQWAERLPSTNAVLCERIRRQAQWRRPGRVLAALSQTAGRGRFERRWVSAPGRDLTFSFVLAPPEKGSTAGSVPLAAALGVADYLESLGMEARIKWPNDVLAPERKVCGILAEGVALGSPYGRVVVGIGLNLAAGHRVGRPPDATSVEEQIGRRPPPPHALRDLLQRLEPRIDAWLRGGFAALRSEAERRAAYVGQPVSVHSDTVIRRGTLAGFGPDGELRITTGNGSTEAVWAGDMVRLRPGPAGRAPGTLP